MRIATLLTAVAVCVLCVAPSVLPQVCGDADSSGGIVDVGDWVRVVMYISRPDITIEATADCDNRSGITIGDAEAMTRYLFFAENSLDCSIQATYGFGPASIDTVFLPFMMDIPDDLDSVVLPVVTSFATDTRAFYIPCWVSETNGPGLFNLQRVDRVEDFSTSFGEKEQNDTVVMLGCDFGFGFRPLVGRHTFFNLVFYRTQPGLANINCASVMRHENWRVSVEKNGDLYAPVVQYYQVPLPHAHVSGSPSPLAMAAKAGFWSTESYQITFTSDLGPVSFNLTPSDSWIDIVNPSFVGYTTPVTITVRANASALSVGNYAGQLTVSDIDPADAEFTPAALDVTLAVTEPVTYPPGDLNCDGQVSIGDISLLIDCLFINTRPVPACE